MKLALVTDAWAPQVNGVVTTLVELVAALQRRGDEVEVIHPYRFKTRPCPGYAGIDLAVRPGRALAAQLDSLQADAVHIATEGPLGWAARRHCLRRGWAFTTAFHTKFPEILNAAAHVPLGWGYALFRHFHAPSAGVMVPTDGVADMLAERHFRNLRRWTHGVDTSLFGFSASPLACLWAARCTRIWGRLSRPRCASSVMPRGPTPSALVGTLQRNAFAAFWCLQETMRSSPELAAQAH